MKLSIYFIPLILFFTLSLALNIFFVIKEYQNQVVIAVPDGDSLDLHDGRRIRLLGVDSPEKGRCGADSAQTGLSELTLGKRVHLKTLVKDDYGRQLALVYTGKTLVQESMIVEGLAKYSSVGQVREASRLKQAAETAIQAQTGIYSPLCRPTTPPEGCTIKGNTRQGEKIYHLPRCKNYDQVIVDLSYGDSWFCTEKEAKEEGFTKAQGC